VRLTTSPPLRAECNENLGASTSWNLLGHTGPVTGLLYLIYKYINIYIYIFQSDEFSVTCYCGRGRRNVSTAAGLLKIELRPLYETQQGIKDHIDEGF